jgi:hypothetical protein
MDEGLWMNEPLNGISAERKGEKKGREKKKRKSSPLPPP